MIFFYIRHGDPIYDPDELTPLGHRQAEALAKRLAQYGIDKIFSSTSNRAIQTAKPTCDLLKKNLETLDFCNEFYAWTELGIETKNGKIWMFDDWDTKLLFADNSIKRLGDRWYEHTAFEAYNFYEGMERIRLNTDEFFKTLGYEHIPGSGKYKVVRSNNERIALFAHQGFGIAFLSCLLDISYPQFCNHFDLCHTGMTVVEFREENGYAIPRVLTMSSDSHLYREGLPTNYNHRVRF